MAKRSSHRPRAKRKEADRGPSIRRAAARAGIDVPSAVAGYGATDYIRYLAELADAQQSDEGTAAAAELRHIADLGDRDKQVAGFGPRPEPKPLARTRAELADQIADLMHPDLVRELLAAQTAQTAPPAAPSNGATASLAPGASPRTVTLSLDHWADYAVRLSDLLSEAIQDDSDSDVLREAQQIVWMLRYDLGIHGGQVSAELPAESEAAE